jgi:glycosidase
MQWSGAANAGFSAGVPWRAVAKDYPQVNVSAQQADSGSLLSHYRKLLTLRAQHPALRAGAVALLATSDPALFAYFRATPEETLLVVLNLSSAPLADYALSLEAPFLKDGSYKVKGLLGAEAGADLKISGGVFSAYRPLTPLAPYGIYLFHVQP